MANADQPTSEIRPRGQLSISSSSSKDLVVFSVAESLVALIVRYQIVVYQVTAQKAAENERGGITMQPGNSGKCLLA